MSFLNWFREELAGGNFWNSDSAQAGWEAGFAEGQKRAINLAARKCDQFATEADKRDGEWAKFIDILGDEIRKLK